MFTPSVGPSLPTRPTLQFGKGVGEAIKGFLQRRAEGYFDNYVSPATRRAQMAVRPGETLELGRMLDDRAYNPPPQEVIDRVSSNNGLGLEPGASFTEVRDALNRLIALAQLGLMTLATSRGDSNDNDGTAG